MKKLLCLLLSVLMIVGAASALSACGSKKSKTVDLQDCQIVYASTLSSGATKRINEVVKQMIAQTGYGPKAFVDTAAAGDAACEILVGDTNRAETAKALKSLKGGDGYVIQTIKNKIVIAGTTPVLTYVALEHFAQTCLPEEANTEGKIIVPQKEVVNCEMLEVADTDGFKYTGVYSQTLDDSTATGSYVGGSADQAAHNSLDFQYCKISEFRSEIMNAFSLRSSAMSMQTDSKKKAEKEYEMLLGQTNRPETLEAQKMINLDQYIVTVINGKIVATAWNDQGVEGAMALLTALMTESIEKDANGKATKIRFPATLALKGKFSHSWVTDFPKPEGMDMIGTCNVGDDHLEYCYQGDGVTDANFTAYRQALLDAGYTIYMENTVEDSRFITFTNAEKKIMLHAIYAAYKHKDENSDTKDAYVPTVRIISAALNKVTLPEANYQKEITYANGKVFNDTNVGADVGALITQNFLSIEESGIFGNSYIITLEDGSFLMYDGGGDGRQTNDDGTTNALSDEVKMDNALEYQRIYAVFKDLQALCGITGKVRLAGWYMSHGHWDHYDVFRLLCKNYGNQIILEKIFANYASDYEIWNTYNPGGYNSSSAQASLASTSGNGQYVKVHGGQVFWVRNLEVQVLYTHEDQYPVNLTYYNDTSTALRIKYHVTDGNGHFLDKNGNACALGADTPVTGIWTGDLFVFGSRYLCAMYGNYLKSDMVQVAHHGANGCESAFYKYVDPTLVWWPTAGSSFYGQTKSAQASWWPNLINYYVAHNLPNVHYIFVAGDVYAATTGYGNHASNTDKSLWQRHNYTIRIKYSGYDPIPYYAFDGRNADPMTGANNVNPDNDPNGHFVGEATIIK